MRHAYALLGIASLVVMGIAYVAFTNTANAPVAHEPLVATSSATAMHETPFSLTSPAFTEGGSIPSRFTCDGENTPPPLTVLGVPPGTQSFALIVEDPDIPTVVKERMGINVFTHYVLFDISPDTTELPEGVAPRGTVGANTRGQGYTGPCPPPEYEPREHRYVFSLLALDTATLNLKAGATASEVREAAQAHTLATAYLIGRYARASSPVVQ